MLRDAIMKSGKQRRADLQVREEVTVMNFQELEQRLIALERDVAQLRSALANGEHAPSWERAVGMFTGDERLKGLFEPALELREKDRARARNRAQRAKRRVKSGKTAQ